MLARAIAYMIQTYREVQNRDLDPEVCCCGEMVGVGGSICAHGGCRSAKEYLSSLSTAEEAKVARLAFWLTLPLMLITYGIAGVIVACIIKLFL